MDERVFVEPTEGQGRNIVPDLRVVERGRPQERRAETGNGVAVAEPLVVHLEESEPVRQGFIEIIDIKSGRRVVTMIEVLSPSNEIPGPGRDLYVKKQEELKAGRVSLVEIDLLRGGTHVLSVPLDRGCRMGGRFASRAGAQAIRFNAREGFVPRQNPPCFDPYESSQNVDSSKGGAGAVLSAAAIGTMSTVTFTVWLPPPRMTPLIGLTSS